MTTSVPPFESRKASIAVGVAAASLTYSMSLPLQQVFPQLKTALSISLDDGSAPTYYLRVAASLLVGLALVALVPRRQIADSVLAWTTGAVLSMSTVLVCVFP